jgi:RimJ/RimL family protein N-acetyltransferase
MNSPSDFCALRPWRDGDQHDLVRHANNRRVWLGLRDRFPHPYTLRDAEAFLARGYAQNPPTGLAIAVDDRPVGGIGLMLGHDVERISAEIGYWLGEEYWGRGIATAAVGSLTKTAFATFELNRLFAVPYADNAASIRVLVKAGYRHEGTLLASAIKDGRIRDQELFAITRREVLG